MTNQDWQALFEEAWEFREEKLYPQHFGWRREGIYLLAADLFTEVFCQDSFDPRWLTHGVFEFGPTDKRPNWLSVSSGLSNAWETDSPERADWPIIVLQRLLAFNILLAHERYGESKPLDYWHRVPLGGPIVGDSPLNHLLIAPPQHYEAQFVLDSGQVDLLHVVGITEQERDYAKEHGSEALLASLQDAGGFPVTNPPRSSVVP
jgi:hypothetical protein